MKVIQVLNNSGLPASGTHDDMAVFSSEKKAQAWIDYLIAECDFEAGELAMRTVEITLSFSYPMFEPED